MALLYSEKLQFIEELVHRLNEHTQHPSCLCSRKQISSIRNKVNRYFWKIIDKKSYELEALINDEFDITRICDECTNESNNICTSCETYKGKHPRHRHYENCIAPKLVSLAIRHQAVCNHLPRYLKENITPIERAEATYDYQLIESLSCTAIETILADGYKAADCVFCNRCKYCSENINCKQK